MQAEPGLCGIIASGSQRVHGIFDSQEMSSAGGSGPMPLSGSDYFILSRRCEIQARRASGRN